MANDGKIYITISDKRGSGGNGVPDSPEMPKPKKDNAELDKLENLVFTNLVYENAKQVVSAYRANIGNFTGDYHRQQVIQHNANIRHQIVSVAKPAIAFAAMGNPVLAVASLAVDAVSKVAQFAIQDKSEAQQNKRTNYEIDQLRKRTGASSLYNDSRTGGY